MVEWSKAPHWKCGDGQLSEGSNPSLSAIFFAKKNGERRRPSSLHCAVRHNFTSSRGDSRSSLNTRSALLVHRSLVRRWMKTLHFIPLVKRSACAARLSRRNKMKPDEVFSLPPSPRLRRTSREQGWCSFFTALRLHGGKPP